MLWATYSKPRFRFLMELLWEVVAGASVHGRFRIATEKFAISMKIIHPDCSSHSGAEPAANVKSCSTICYPLWLPGVDCSQVFAMPETALGLFPDVGASYFLSRFLVSLVPLVSFGQVCVDPCCTNHNHFSQYFYGCRGGASYCHPLAAHRSAQSMWAYLKKVYHQDNDARRFQLEHVIAMFQHGSLSIQDYYSAFLTLWHEYADLVTADVPIAALSTIQTIHATTRRDQFLMKLRPEYESVRSSLLNRSPVPSLDICFGELLHEEQCLSTQAILEQSHGSSGTTTVAYAAQGRGPPMHSKNLQCFCCKEYGHIAATCPKKFCSYCKKKGHIIKECRIRPQNCQAQAFQTSVIVPPVATHDSPSAACSVPAPPAPDYCTPEMVQRILISALSAMGFQGPDLSMVWHRRLGHPNTQILSHVLNSDLPGNKDRYSLSLECDSCKLGKSKTLPFPLHASRASHCFDLIHSDVWGPSPVSSYEKFKYYVTFIDDHSRFTWVYFLCSKSEVFRTFTEFLAYVDNQFSTSIKTLRTDSGGEYLSTEFQAFLASKGIIHQRSCPFTPQQNGVAERKNRHLLDVVRTLLLESSVPSMFWVEALKTATHLINRLPSQVLHMESPYFRLFAKQPSYDHLRIFGCVCFVHLPPHERHKLSAQSVRCAFLGYNMCQKGFVCYDPTLHRTRISRNVIFFENQHFFPVSSSTVSSSSTVVLPSFEQ
ncbi:Retrovirus-related Pol polyprotein from transposon RE2 [Vitis vinifera]|uniref:Retrovirus-related Pol polyprotein from transposon RE2 n=1 Tax=Vitis vinifera TaxID=29760 RepID=A0A438D9R0_VITVI|nr:Retrovirus-related Pol polyprotein from transposon RE2 [Vitis vinifera]